MRFRPSWLLSDRQRYLFQRRVAAIRTYLRPPRWDRDAAIKPLDQHLENLAQQPIDRRQLLGLRYFWLDGLFAATSDSFNVDYVALFALAYGASTGQVGWLASIANLLGAVALFPGARLAERAGKRVPVVVWTGGGIGRAVLLALACFPFLIGQPDIAIPLIIGLSGLRAFMGNLGNPAWTAIVADLVPGFMRGRYFANRNIAMGIAALAVAPLAGWLIHAGNGWLGLPFAGFQLVFSLAFAFGMVSSASFWRIPEPPLPAAAERPHQSGDLRRALSSRPGFLGFVVSGFIWNLGLQLAGPFFNVYLVSQLNANLAMVGLVTGIGSLFALAGQRVFGRLLDHKGSLWVQTISGLSIPALPLAWILVTSPWQVGIINAFSGVLWAGYNLSNFNLLLELSPPEQRPRAVALYQTVVFVSAVLGPLLGGYLADAAGFKLIFGLSGACRMLGMMVFLWMVARPVLRVGRGLLSRR
jgi:MFS family permease